MRTVTSDLSPGETIAPPTATDLSEAGTTPGNPATLPEHAAALSPEERLAERARWAASVLRDCVEADGNKRGGIPVLKGTRFTVAQVFAELGDGRNVAEIAADFDVELDTLKALLQGFATHLDRPMLP